MSYSVVLSSVLLAAGTLFAQAPAAAPAKKSAPAAKPAATKKPTPAPASQGAAAPAAAPAPVASADDKIVMTVGTEKVTAKEYNAIVKALPDQFRSQAEGPMKRQVAEQVASVKLLAQEARKRGLDKDQDVQTRIQLQADNLLAGAAFSEILKATSVDDAALRKQYEARKNEYETAEARHILIKFKGSPVPAKEGQKELTEEEALSKVQEIRKQILAGGDFAEIAKKESDDAGSGANGGTLGNFGRGQMVPAFDEAVFKQPIGELSEPIKTQFGYHIIRVDKRESKPFEQVRDQLAEQLKPTLARESVEKMRASSVKLEDSFFGPATPPAPAAAPAPAGQ
jgi:peptidyl-prolyl cis-trans isomerase C